MHLATKSNKSKTISKKKILNTERPKHVLSIWWYRGCISCYNYKTCFGRSNSAMPHGFYLYVIFGKIILSTGRILNANYLSIVYYSGTTIIIHKFFEISVGRRPGGQVAGPKRNLAAAGPLKRPEYKFFQKIIFKKKQMNFFKEHFIDKKFYSGRILDQPYFDGRTCGRQIWTASWPSKDQYPLLEPMHNQAQTNHSLSNVRAGLSHSVPLTNLYSKLSYQNYGSKKTFISETKLNFEFQNFKILINI
ncbi:hypothetical protein BpHYR1_048926 [Brachionus plicatilis]|uniref:Uncharacterized protein n=1 Tax=Brachionus plicatilis TaxID=10195 RepID=A0A3M7PWI6_BRAPC|nr:hypothetical protein BpHYR1_048926 [Brachionus plicatilis]